MLNGVTLLNKVDIFYYEGWAKWWPIYFVVGLIVLIAGINLFDEYCNVITLAISIIGGAIMVFSVVQFLITMFSEGTYDHTEYEVIVAPEVSFMDIEEKYEVVDQRGLIFTIKERDADNEQTGNDERDQEEVHGLLR